jgi:hypothetical protein
VCRVNNGGNLFVLSILITDVDRRSGGCESRARVVFNRIISRGVNDDDTTFYLACGVHLGEIKNEDDSEVLWKFQTSDLRSGNIKALIWGILKLE